MARLIPVLDVMGGRVVRAVGGRRNEYRPLVSKLTDSTEPVEVAQALLASTGAADLYLADLDTFAGRYVSECVSDFLAVSPVATWVDAGLRDESDMDLLPPGQHIYPVVATESAEDLGLVRWAETTGGYTRSALSIDLANGSILGRWQEWGCQNAADVVGLAKNAVGRGIRTLILIDLVGVGTQDGSRTTAACRAVRKAFPHVELITGGGVRDRDDLQRLEDAGADAVLVASALHDGMLP